jgi:chromate transporter
VGSALEVLWIFLKLGVSCFGGPVAHLGYFRSEFVVRRSWLSEESYADLVGLCQFLPGPASSQVGFSIGLLRAGYAGGLAAWAGFTLPSAALLVLFAYGLSILKGTLGMGLLHGLKLVAVAIVGQAVWSMGRTLCPDRARAGIAVGVGVLVLLYTDPLTQILAILLGSAAGLALCRTQESMLGRGMAFPVSRRAGVTALALFLALLGGLPFLASWRDSSAFGVFNAFYRSGALVFGGGHVVLPLLREAFVGPGWLTDDTFIAGYGAAQAIPGPLFTFAAFLGAVAHAGPGGLAGAALGLVGIFLPGILLIIGTLPFWSALRARAGARALMRGVNAAVVGLLAAALYNPLWIQTVHTPVDIVVALLGFLLLAVWRLPPLLIVLGGAFAGMAASQLGG